MDTDSEMNEVPLAQVESVFELKGLGAHGRQWVDITVLSGALTTMVVTLRGGTIRMCNVVGVAHDLDHQIVLRESTGRCELLAVETVRAALPRKEMRVEFDMEHEVLCLRHKLSKP